MAVLAILSSANWSPHRSCIILWMKCHNSSCQQLKFISQRRGLNDKLKMIKCKGPVDLKWKYDRKQDVMCGFWLFKFSLNGGFFFWNMTKDKDFDHSSKHLFSIYKNIKYWLISFWKWTLYSWLAKKILGRNTYCTFNIFFNIFVYKFE